MVFDKITKQAFVHPPKTGTFAARNFLKSIGWKVLPEVHAFPSGLISKYPNLEQYKIYGFLRNPVERFESAILHLKRSPAFSKRLKEGLERRKVFETIENVSYEVLVENFAALEKLVPVFFQSQSAWLDHSKVTVLDFRNMEAELRRITGNTEQPLVRYNTSTDFGRSVITPAVEEFVRQQYADDYVLASKVGLEF